MEDVREYLHLYLGCEVVRDHNPNRSDKFFEKAKLIGITESEIVRGKHVVILDVGLDHFHEWYVEECKPILRRLESMTEEEKIELHTYTYPNGIGKYRLKEDKINLIDYALDLEMKDSSSKSEKIMSFITIYQIALMNKWLLSKGFWLFGNEAFDKGLIIDSKTLNKEV